MFIQILDKIEWDKYQVNKIKNTAKQKTKTSQHQKFSLEEFRWLLLAAQSWICNL